MDEENKTDGTTDATTDAATDAATEAATAAAAAAGHDEISYHAVQKDGNITAIWEMRGRKHVRTIDPRSEEGKHLLGHHEPQSEAGHEGA